MRLEDILNLDEEVWITIDRTPSLISDYIIDVQNSSKFRNILEWVGRPIILYQYPESEEQNILCCLGKKAGEFFLFWYRVKSIDTNKGDVLFANDSLELLKEESESEYMRSLQFLPLKSKLTIEDFFRNLEIELRKLLFPTTLKNDKVPEYLKEYREYYIEQLLKEIKRSRD